MKSRGQAALEFLSTYGFAFLVILVMIGALSYFGILNPGRLLPERCLVGQEFGCNEYQIQEQSTTANGGVVVRFGLQNNLGTPVQFSTTVDASSEDYAQSADSCTIGDAIDGSGSVDNTNVTGGTLTIQGGKTGYFECTLDSAAFPSPGEKITVVINGEWRRFGANLWSGFSTEVLANVQAE